MAQELKAGDSVDFQIGDKTLTIEAVPYKNVKKIFKIVFNVIGEMGKDSGEAALIKVPRIMEQNIGVLLPLLFWPGKYDFLTEEWIDDNITINDIRKIIEAAIKVNGLQDFFDKTGAKLNPVPVEAEDNSQVKPTVV